MHTVLICVFYIDTVLSFSFRQIFGIGTSLYWYILYGHGNYYAHTCDFVSFEADSYFSLSE